MGVGRREYGACVCENVIADGAAADGRAYVSVIADCTVAERTCVSKCITVDSRACAWASSKHVTADGGVSGRKAKQGWAA